MRRDRTRPIRDRGEFLCLEEPAYFLHQKGVFVLVQLLHGWESFIAISSGRGRLGEVDAFDVSASDRTREFAQ